MSKFIMMSFIPCLSGFMYGNPEASDSAGVAQNPTHISDAGSFWAMAQLGGGIGYVIMIVLALGVFLIVLKALQLWIDKRQARPLLQTSFSHMNAQEIKEMAGVYRGSILGKTIGHLIDFHRAGGQAESIHNELVFYMDQENENFETYRNWLHFLSDSAGALGLLGTVWGMFLTFFGGNLDSEKILNGMGVALVTTLLGLVVSLIINLFATQMYGAFQKRLELVTRKADELRLHLLQLEDKSAQPDSPPARINENHFANTASPQPPGVARQWPK
jgi:biopolymer transport protein ExbB/TolQ